MEKAGPAIGVTIAFILLSASHVTGQYNNTGICVDSDGGEDYYARGMITTDGRTRYTDSCVTPSQLQEGYCEARRRVAHYKTTFFQCPRGCYRGVCRPLTPQHTTSWTNVFVAANATSTTTTSTTVFTVSTSSTTSSTIANTTLVIRNGVVCTDSDGGKSYGLRGEISLNGKKLWLDSCVNPSQLQEGFCDKGKRFIYYSTLFHSCPNGCYLGKCW
ncbi:MAG: hypothetical protein V1744_08555 [Candidatus Altiarchaeota archaeon]